MRVPQSARVSACACVLLVASTAAAQVDLAPRPLERLAETEFTQQSLPSGYSHVVMLAWPRLTAESKETTPGMAAKFAQLFGSVILADVRQSPGPEGEFRLNRLAIGHVMRSGDKLKVVTPATVSLPFLERQVLSAAEKELDKVRQIARYDTALLFETPAIIRRGDKHVEMRLRQFVWTSAKQGGLASALWLLDVSQPQAPRVADDYFIQAPAGFVDDRLLSVDPAQFNLLGMPGPTAFALVHLPQANQIAFTPELAQLAAMPRYTPETLPLLAGHLARVIANNPASAVTAR